MDSAVPVRIGKRQAHQFLPGPRRYAGRKKSHYY
jgi:hypothetical protein